MIRDWSNFIADRTAIVTGSGGGVGRAIAIQMARAGAHVWINDLYPERAEQVAAEIRAEQGLASVVIADVCDPDEVARMVAETGPVDILVNNAGIPPEGFQVKSFVDTSPADWDPMIRLNLAAVLHVSHAYLPLMIERRWGRILTIVSTPAGAVSASRWSTARRRPPRWASRAAWPPRSDATASR